MEKEKKSNGFNLSNGAALANDLEKEAESSSVSVHAHSPLTASTGLTGGDYVTLTMCSGCGFVFGIAAEKARGI